MTTYGNVPHKSSRFAAVLRIETKSNPDQTAIIGQTIMTDVFGNNTNTIYVTVYDTAKIIGTSVSPNSVINSTFHYFNKTTKNHLIKH